MNFVELKTIEENRLDMTIDAHTNLIKLKYFSKCVKINKKSLSQPIRKLGDGALVKMVSGTIVNLRVKPSDGFESSWDATRFTVSTNRISTHSYQAISIYDN